MARRPRPRPPRATPPTTTQKKRRRLAPGAQPEPAPDEPRPPSVRGAFLFGIALVLAAIAVASAGTRLAKRTAGRFGDEIAIDGRLERIGTPVVLWSDEGGYDAYQRHCDGRPERVLPSSPAKGCEVPERIGARSGAGPLAGRITQFVIHYDQSYTSRNCFHVLQDVRGLSVHFLCDLDGTIYQTCDVRERARHARDANDRSVGVEVAHPGALELVKGLAERYRRDAAGEVYLELPAWLGGPDAVRTPGFFARPARPEPIRGEIQGRVQTQWDFTDAQYRALARLAAGLSRALPRIALEVPRDGAGRIADRALDPAAAARFEGVLGHYHLQTDKFDPGPAFDWERLLAEARALR